MLRPKKLGLLGVICLLATGMLAFISISSINGVSAQSPYATPSIESSSFSRNCITDMGDYISTNNLVLLSKCNGHYSQYWQYSPGSMQITFQHDQSICLMPMNRSAARNVPAVIGPCSGVGIFWTQFDGSYKNRLSGLCLSALNPNDILRLESCKNLVDQKWNDPDYLINPNLCGDVITANATQAQCIGLDLMQIYPYFWNPYQPVTLSNSEQSSQWQCLVSLWDRESSWGRTEGNVNDAYGIPQADPGYTDYKDSGYPAALPPYNSAISQIRWGLGYILGRYGSPCGAWEHEIQYNWYVVNTQSN
jgi:hypothetical protein